MVRLKKFFLSGLCQNSVLAPYCKDWEPRYSTNTSERLQFPWISHRTPPRHPPDNPKASPGNMTCQETTTDANRHSQTSQDTAMCCWVCLAVSFGASCSLLLSVGMSCSLDMSGAVWGMSGAFLRVSEWYLWKLEALRCVWGGLMGSQSLQYGANTLF